MDVNLIHFLNKQASDWPRNHVLSPEDADAAEGLTGLSFTELVQQRRFEQAQRLLRETEMPIADISTAIGYENVSYFTTFSPSGSA